MRIDRPDSQAAITGRPDTSWARARRWLADRGPFERLVGILGIVALIAAVGLLAAKRPVSSRVWLYPDQTLSHDDAQRIVQHLLLRAIDARNVGGRIEVPAAKQTAAYAEIEKAGLEPLSPRQIKDQPPQGNPFLLPDQLARLDERGLERFVESSLRRIDPALSAIVDIDREPARGLRRGGGLRVTVELEMDRGRPIPPELAERVRNKVRGWLEPDHLTLLSSRGDLIFSSDDPKLGQRTLIDAREDVLRAELLAGLDWIEGVRVNVSVEPGPEPIEPPDPTGPPGPISAAVTTDIEPEPIIRPNEPMAALPPSPPAVSTAAAPPMENPNPLRTDVPLRPTGKVNVTILVPSRYYVSVARTLAGDVVPSPESLQKLAARTEVSIRSVVERVVPAAELGSVTIDRIFTPAPERFESPPAAPATISPELPDWWPAAAGAGVIAGAALLIVAGSRLRGANPAPRRPARRVASRRRFDVGVDEPTGPSERVRALIRQDPAAAAGVLRRWIGQGGPDS